MSVVLKGVTATYDSRTGIKDVSFTAESHRYVGILGGSGSGKTTLLRAIAGLIPTTAGSISLEGVDVTTMAIESRHVGFVFQGFALFPNLDVAGNVAYGLKARGVPPNERASRVAEALELAGLPRSEHRRVDTLSGGEQQRVAIARALAPRPRVLLLDEPLANLDAALRLATRERLRTLHEAARITTLHVTHDREEALAVADDLAILTGGHLQQFGPAESVWNEPNHAETAEFLGMFLRDAVATSDGLTIDGLRLHPMSPSFLGPCRVAIRSVDLQFDGEGGPWRIEHKKNLGDTVEFHLESAYGSLRMRTSPHAIETRLGPKARIAIKLYPRTYATFTRQARP